MKLSQLKDLVHRMEERVRSGACEPEVIFWLTYEVEAETRKFSPERPVWIHTEPEECPDLYQHIDVQGVFNIPLVLVRPL